MCSTANSVCIDAKTGHDRLAKLQVACPAAKPVIYFLSSRLKWWWCVQRPQHTGGRDGGEKESESLARGVKEVGEKGREREREGDREVAC